MKETTIKIIDVFLTLTKEESLSSYKNTKGIDSKANEVGIPI
ncbi:hypothetical protein [Flagellimonas sp.]